MSVGDETIRSLNDTVARDPLLGTVVEEYELTKCIGQGAMGLVYRGVHRVIGKTAAVKVLKLDFADDPEMVQRVVAEARTVNAIHHPGIVDVFGFGTLRTGQPYIIMDLLEGEPLDAYIQGRAPVTVAEAMPLLDDLLGALGAAHGVGVIHRDLKPGNVFRESHPEARSRIKIIDFGLARQADRAGGSVKPTNPGTLLGTPAFMAPEQILGQKVTPASDLYAVGGIAYQLLTGHLPHEAPSAMEMLSRKMSQLPTKPRQLNPALSEALEAWVMSLLLREASERPQTADEARQKLRAAVESAPTSTSSSGSNLSPVGRSGKHAALGVVPKAQGWNAKTESNERTTDAERVALVPTQVAPESPAPAPTPVAPRNQVRTDPYMHAPAEPTVLTAVGDETLRPMAAPVASGESSPMWLWVLAGLAMAAVIGAAVWALRT